MYYAMVCVNIYLLCLKVEIITPKSHPIHPIHVKFYKFYLVFLYNCGVECCIIIYNLCFNGLCKVMGVLVSFLNDGKRLNLNNYGLGF